MASTLKIVQGNTAPIWIINCERDGEAINLSGCTVTVNITDGITITRTGGACTITDSANGIISYRPTVSDTAGGGPFQVDVRILYGDGSHEVLYQQLKVNTRPPII
jgi:hypothetical protein